MPAKHSSSERRSRKAVGKLKPGDGITVMFKLMPGNDELTQCPFPMHVVAVRHEEGKAECVSPDDADGAAVTTIDCHTQWWLTRDAGTKGIRGSKRSKRKGASAPVLAAAASAPVPAAAEAAASAPVLAPAQASASAPVPAAAEAAASVPVLAPAQAAASAPVPAASEAAASAPVLAPAPAGKTLFTTMFVLPASKANDPNVKRHCEAIANATEEEFGGPPAGGGFCNYDGNPCFRMRTAYTNAEGRNVCVLWEGYSKMWLCHVLRYGTSPSHDFIESAGHSLLPRFDDSVGRTLHSL